MKHLDIIVDLQYGSTGKGLIAGYLAEENRYDTVINANMPNAGHTYVNNEGRTWIHKVLPNGIVSPNLKRVMLGPGSIFSEKRLLQELDDSIDLLRGVDVIIHENAVVLTKEHAMIEQEKLRSISSTMQGSASAMIQKIWRQAENNPCIGAVNLPESLNNKVKVVSSNEWNIIMMREVEYALLEGAQGYSLGINAGFYPFCTSRDCTPSRFMADCQIPFNTATTVIGTARVHPIRVGSLPGTTSGGHYADQQEISWAKIGQDPETTTVTGRERRVFDFSQIQIEQAIIVCQPNKVFLNFCNYNLWHASEAAKIITKSLRELGPTGAHIGYLGWGPAKKDVVEETHLHAE
jgi:adenylosuccinate synthase